jgi:polysaccharide pyruvyl transferase WcaK-like protein
MTNDVRAAHHPEMAPEPLPTGERADERADAPRVFIDWASNEVANLGDAAMLQALVQRLRRHWPDAIIAVPTTEPEGLAALDGDLTPLRTYPTALGRLPGLARSGALAAHRLVGPASGRGQLGAAVAAADLVVAAGGGYLADPFGRPAHAVLAVLQAGQRHGARTAALGQGLGPVDGALLRRHLARVVPGLDLLAVRDRGSVRLADTLGVAARLTGDDAHEIAVTGQVATGTRVGMCLRLAGYAGLGPDTIPLLRNALSSTLEGAPVSIVPIARGRNESDVNTTTTVLDDPRIGDVASSTPDTPAALRLAVSDCRVMVTSAYHAAVFALAQGIPVVALATTPYYVAKFGGLADLFGADACQILDPADPGGPNGPGTTLTAALARALRTAHELSPDRRQQVVAAAMSQADAGRVAVANLVAHVEQDRHDQPGRGRKRERS